MQCRAADLVLIHGLRLFLGTLGAIYCLMTGKPYVMFPHGMAVPRWRSFHMKRAYNLLIGNWLLRGSAGVFCLSKSEREETIAAATLDPRRVKVVSITSPLALDARLEGPATWGGTAVQGRAIRCQTAVRRARDQRRENRLPEREPPAGAYV